MSDMNASLDLSGAIVKGTAKDIIEDYTEEAAREVAQEATNEIQAKTSVFRRPTGRYKRSIVTDRSTTGFTTTDGGVRYGPWLEGVSRRNTRSRFKGYHIWRKARQEIDGQASVIAERVLPRHLKRLED